MSAQDEINRKLREIESLKQEQTYCQHQWGPTKYDAEKKVEFVNDYSRGLQGHGSDPYYHTIAQDKYVDRWSRTCNKCGKTEYTYTQETVEVIKKPKF